MARCSLGAISATGIWLVCRVRTREIERMNVNAPTGRGAKNRTLLAVGQATLFLTAFLGSPIGAEPSRPPSHLLKDIDTSPTKDSRSLPTGFQHVGNVTLFGVNTASGSELWRTDLTPEGTFRLKEFNKGSYLEWRAMVGGFLLFAAGDEAHGFEVWRTDGTEAGTVL